MWIVAIAWIYVVVLMAATEPTVVGGIMTFLFYCAVPLSILFYIAGAKRRRRRLQRQAAPGRTEKRDRDESGGGPDGGPNNGPHDSADADGGGDGD